MAFEAALESCPCTDENRLGCIIQSLEASYHLGQMHIVYEIADTLSPIVAEMVAPKAPRPASPNPDTWGGRVEKNNEEKVLIERWGKDEKKRTGMQRIQGLGGTGGK